MLTHRRTLSLLLAAGLAVVLAATGCGGSANNPPATADDNLGTASGEPSSPGATPTDGQPTQTTSKPATPATEAKYPDSARAYSEALLRAWAGPNYTRLGELGTPAAVQQIRDSITSGGNPNSNWSYIRCGAAEASGYTDCIFRNSHGDEAKITSVNGQIGYHNAITAAGLDRTTYPNDPVNYSQNLFSAYGDGNMHRVLRLSNETVRSKLACTFGYTPSTAPIDGTHTKVILNETGGSLSKRLELKVLSQPGGKSGAVKEALLVQC